MHDRYQRDGETGEGAATRWKLRRRAAVWITRGIGSSSSKLELRRGSNKFGGKEFWGAGGKFVMHAPFVPNLLSLSACCLK